MDKVDRIEIKRVEKWNSAKFQFYEDGDIEEYKHTIREFFINEKMLCDGEDESETKIREEKEKKLQNLLVKHTQRIMLLNSLRQNSHNVYMRDKEGLVYYVDRTLVFFGAGVVFFHSWNDVVDDLTKKIIVVSLLTILYASSMYLRWRSNYRNDANVIEEEKLREIAEADNEVEKQFIKT